MTDRQIKWMRLVDLVGWDKMPLVEKLHRKLVSYDRLQEVYCNGQGYWHGYEVTAHTDYDNPDEPIIKAEKRHERRIVELVREINPRFVVRFGGDPRGYCVKIYKDAKSLARHDSLSWLFYY